MKNDWREITPQSDSSFFFVVNLSTYSAQICRQKIDIHFLWIFHEN
ncbi:hypothetical protein HMPREF0650_1389 [Hoylesella buccalis ATCC 35310]|uniref:Uncharacterized protein n=1 Tax=Hoylesella buccalis ATCC 35310 TaxID=679190 RepID=D1W4J3_9BACT|nr:hypothetical protein HMPREF0650_1389 [Hoylesella buccalis ATCC 35310]